MKPRNISFSLLLLLLLANFQYSIAENYYETAYREMSQMLSGQTQPSIKRAVFLAEWAYYDGNLDYNKDFCDEIDRIVKYVRLFYDANNLRAFKTGKQKALNEYFFRPYSGNGYKPYTYDFENFSIDDDCWETQFVTKVLKTHYGQCRSLPWLYKILAVECGADVFLAHAPRHCYIMYKDEDNTTPEEWINLELSTHQLQPAWCIKLSNS